MAFGQDLRVDDRSCIRKCCTEIMMISDHYIQAARIGIVYGFVRGNARVTGDDQFCAIINNGLKGCDMDAVPLLAANGDIESDVRFHAAKCLDQQCRGSLSIHIKVAAYADGFIILYSRLYRYNRFFDLSEWRA